MIHLHPFGIYNDEFYEEVTKNLFKELRNLKERIEKVKFFNWVAFSAYDEPEYKYGGFTIGRKGDVYIVSPLGTNTIVVYVSKRRCTPIEFSNYNLDKEIKENFINIKKI